MKKTAKKSTKVTKVNAKPVTVTCHACAKKVTDAEMVTYNRGLCATHESKRAAIIAREDAAEAKKTAKPATKATAAAKTPRTKKEKPAVAGTRHDAAMKAWDTIRAKRAASAKA